MVSRIPIYFTKVLNVKSPGFGTPGSAGIDFYCPENTPEFLQELKSKNKESNITINIDNKSKDYGIWIRSQSSVIIPSGIIVGFPKNYVLIGFNKSGISFQRGLILGACVIDSDYSGMIYINFINTSNNDQLINFGQKLTQFILLENPAVDLLEVPYSKIQAFHQFSERKGGAFGSTDSKPEKQNLSQNYSNINYPLNYQNIIDGLWSCATPFSDFQIDTNNSSN